MTGHGVTPAQLLAQIPPAAALLVVLLREADAAEQVGTLAAGAAIGVAWIIADAWIRRSHNQVRAAAIEQETAILIDTKVHPDAGDQLSRT